MSKFIVIEGVGGAGKTTQIENLKKQYPDALFVREPGGTIPGEDIRDVLFKHVKNLDPIAQLYLVHSARWQNVIENILPALERDQIVICDRFQLSTFAYQVFPSSRDDVMEHMLETQAQFLAIGLQPHYIFLDVEPEISMKRIETGREDDNDSFDDMALDFHNMTYQGYKQGITEMGLSCSVIDAGQNIDAVTKDVQQAVKDVIAENNE